MVKVFRFHVSHNHTLKVWQKHITGVRIRIAHSSLQELCLKPLPGKLATEMSGFGSWDLSLAVRTISAIPTSELPQGRPQRKTSLGQHTKKQKERNPQTQPMHIHKWACVNIVANLQFGFPFGFDSQQPEKGTINPPPKNEEVRLSLWFCFTATWKGH